MEIAGFVETFYIRSKSRFPYCPQFSDNVFVLSDVKQNDETFIKLQELSQRLNSKSDVGLNLSSSSSKN